MTAERYPLDFDALNKGDIIPVEKIERITESRFGSMDYQLRAMQLRELIRRKLEARGLIVAIRFDHGHLRILDDAEASVYASDAIQLALRKAISAHKTQLAVDAQQLTDEESDAHERRLIRDGRMIQALAQAGLNVPAITHRRTVPGLPGSGSDRSSDVRETEVSDSGRLAPDRSQREACRPAVSVDAGTQEGDRQAQKDGRGPRGDGPVGIPRVAVSR
jgi:hypothetical protein